MGARGLRRLWSIPGWVPAWSIPGWVPALAIYAAAALLLLARYALADPAHVCVCLGPNGDPPFFMWALKWWPYAISHGLNPFYSHAVWYPGGANIATVTGIPGAALALWPVTSLFGPVVAYDVAAVLGPVLSALAAYALCRALTGRWWASVVGGFIYGFSSYELGQLLGHLHITLIFLVPLIPLLVIRRLGGALSRPRFVVLLAAVLSGQVLLSTEITFDVGLLGALGLAVALVFAPRGERRRLMATAAEMLAAGLLALVVVSPYLYWALVKGNPGDYGQVTGTHFADRYRLDPLNLLVPTPLTWLLGRSFPGTLKHFEGGNVVEAGGYLGLPLLILFATFAVATWRRPGTRFLLGMAAVAGVLALGPRLTSGSHTVTRLPWQLVENAPVFKAVLPTRFSLFLALIVGVGVAIELGRDRRRPWLAWAVAIAGVIAVLPDPTAPFWHSRPPAVPLVVTASKRYLPATGSILMVPVGQFGSSMYWQGASDFAFPLANGRVALVLPPEYAAERASLDMANGIGPPRRARLYEFLVRHRVSAVVVAPALHARWDPALRRLGLQARDVSGTSVYYVCGVPAAVRSCAGPPA